jgi:hypothetical protein
MNASKPAVSVPEGPLPAAVATSPSPLAAPRRRSNHTRHPSTGQYIKGSKGRFGS